ncbi:MAG TPA: hypothetical protein DCS93_13435 [Microscillaceae bacterium]|nr:hypothetical protein [Microscillaceae bacterium]
MNIYKSKYQFINYLKDQALMEVGFFPETEFMLDYQYRDEAEIFLTIISEEKPHQVLFDFRNLMFIVTPETQDWFSPKLGATYANLGYKIKQAMVVSQDFVSQLATEQIINDTDTFQIQYFSDEQKARDWLKAS